MWDDLSKLFFWWRSGRWLVKDSRSILHRVKWQHPRRRYILFVYAPIIIFSLFRALYTSIYAYFCFFFLLIFFSTCHFLVNFQRNLPDFSTQLLTDYDIGVQYIIDGVVDELLKDSRRKFIYVEVAFFIRWWREQTEARKEQVKGLVKSGQLEFINGGWSMNGEQFRHSLSDLVWGHFFSDCGVDFFSDLSKLLFWISELFPWLNSFWHLKCFYSE